MKSNEIKIQNVLNFDKNDFQIKFKNLSLLFIGLFCLYIIAKNSSLAASIPQRNENIMPLMLFFIVLSYYKITFWILFFPFVFLSSLYLPVAVAFGRMDYSFLASIINTDVGEALEFFKLLSIFDIFRSLAILVCFVLYKIIIDKFELKIWKNFHVIAFMIILTLYYSKVFNLPKDLFFSVKELSREYKNISEGGLSWDIKDISPTYDNYVLVLGESARRDYHEIYGYPEKNNPFLSGVNATIIEGLISGGPNTINSLKLMLTDPIKESKKARKDFNIISMANQAGFETNWISNQGYSSKHGSYVSNIANSSDYKFFLKNQNFDATNTDDLDLIPFFEKRVNEKSDKKIRFFVLHLTGSHSYTCDRLHSFPNNFSSLDEKNKEVSCYVASIEKTDYLLSEINTILKERMATHNEKYSLVYFSDHGLSSQEKSDGHLSMRHLNVKQQYDVPLLKISSDDVDRKFIKARKSGLNMTLGLGKWMGITINNSEGNYDLFSNKDHDDYGYLEMIKGLPDNPTIYLKK